MTNKINKKTKSKTDQYNLVQIGDVTVCSTSRGLRDVAYLANQLANKEKQPTVSEQKSLLSYIG